MANVTSETYSGYINLRKQKRSLKRPIAEERGEGVSTDCVVTNQQLAALSVMGKNGSLD